MTAPDRQRDGGVYSPGTVCPHCNTCDVHPKRKPLAPAPGLPWQFDERRFVYIRTCTGCGYEWGQR